MHPSAYRNKRASVFYNSARDQCARAYVFVRNMQTTPKIGTLPPPIFESSTQFFFFFFVNPPNFFFFEKRRNNKAPGEKEKLGVKIDRQAGVGNFVLFAWRDGFWGTMAVK